MAGPRLVAFAAALLVGTCFVLARRDGRAVDGVATDITEAPWLVQFEYFDGQSFDNTMTCSGSIVSDTQVLTAAHCFPADIAADPQSRLKVRVGATNKQEGGTVHAVESIVMHPNFDDVSTDQPWDLAVVNLAEPIEFGDAAKAIEITKERIASNTHAVSGGWGSAQEDAGMAPEDFACGLKTIELLAKDDQQCKDFVSLTTVSDEEGKKTLVCFWPKTGMTCTGDSGTGVWTPAQDGEAAKLYGVLHGANSCDPATGIPIFVDLSASLLRDFLDENVKQSS